MTNKEINKLMEIQYLKGRLDELYKGYVPNNSTTDNRIVDSRISKYEEKLKNIDETAFYLYQVERENVRVSKQKSKEKIKDLLTEVLPSIYNDTLKEKVDEYGSGNTSNIILILSESQHKDALVVDKEITFMSCIIQIVAL